MATEERLQSRQIRWSRKEIGVAEHHQVSTRAFDSPIDSPREVALETHFHDRRSAVGSVFTDRGSNVLLRVVVDDDHLDVRSRIAKKRRQ
jgi:hypothetical protein